MNLDVIKDKIPKQQYEILAKDISTFRPSQEKSLSKGLLEGSNVVVCTPTASGKTLIAELAMVSKILKEGRKAIYLAPLKALANEKFVNFKERYKELRLSIVMSLGDLDSPGESLAKADLIITVPEKLDSLLRHNPSWISSVGVVVVDEIHLLNDPSRGPTLEIILTLLKTMIKPQIIGLSATIGNPKELASWLDAELVIDTWRPVELKQGIYVDEELEFY